MERIYDPRCSGEYPMPKTGRRPLLPQPGDRSEQAQQQRAVVDGAWQTLERFTRSDLKPRDDHIKQHLPAHVIRDGGKTEAVERTFGTSAATITVVDEHRRPNLFRRVRALRVIAQYPPGIRYIEGRDGNRIPIPAEGGAIGFEVEEHSGLFAPRTRQASYSFTEDVADLMPNGPHAYLAATLDVVASEYEITELRPLPPAPSKYAA